MLQKKVSKGAADTNDTQVAQKDKKGSGDGDNEQLIDETNSDNDYDGQIRQN